MACSTALGQPCPVSLVKLSQQAVFTKGNGQGQTTTFKWTRSNLFFLASEDKLFLVYFH